jgi:transposase-like protein
MPDAPTAWTEFDCPNCGQDSDIEPAKAYGTAYRCPGCDQTFTLTPENAQTCEIGEDGELRFR